jgi:hypothetical protein
MEKVNKHEIRKAEEAFKTCFQADPGELPPGTEWQRNLMINIRAIAAPASRQMRPRQEIIIWRLAWTSLAASLILAAVFSFSQTGGDDSPGGGKWEEKIFAINDIIRE